MTKPTGGTRPTMIRVPTTVLAVALVALHAAFGCGWHHDHAAPSSAYTPGHCDCGHHGTPVDEDLPATPAEPCDDDGCQFVATVAGAGQGSAHLKVVDGPQPPGLAAVVSVVRSSDVSATLRLHANPRPAPPVRARSQVWLL